MYNFIITGIIAVVVSLGGFFGYQAINEPQLGLSVFFPTQGGTGTSTSPTTNDILVGNSSGVYDVKTLTAGSNVTIDNSGTTVTISSSGGGGGGGSGSIGTTTHATIGYLAWWDTVGTLGSIATGTLSTNATGLELDATRSLVGGSATLSLTSGYNIPLNASTTNWNDFYDTPSNRITAGTGLTWSGNTLNADNNGTVTSVAQTVPTGLTISGSPITTTGTLALGLDTGYRILLATSTTDLQTVHAWGNHADAGYALTSQLHDAVTLGGSLDYITLSGQVLTRNAIDLTTDTTGTLDETNGGTGQSTVSTGDILYGSASNTFSKLTIGANGTCLTVASGLPSWATCSGGSSSGSTAWATTSPYSGQIVLYPEDTTADVVFGGTATTTAPFWFDVSATSFHVGTGGTATNSEALFGGETDGWLFGRATSTGSFHIASSSANMNALANRAVFTIPNTGSSTLYRALDVHGALGADRFISSSTSLVNFFTLANITKLSNLTTNGIVKVGSSDGTLSSVATLANSDLTNSTISGISLGSNLADLTATNGSLTFSGTYNGSTARTIGVNLAHNFTWTGAHDLGGATSIEIPNGASPTVDATGEIALETTTNSLRIATSTAYPIIVAPYQTRTFEIASSSWTSTSTAEYTTLDFGEQYTTGVCYTNTGTAILRLGDGTNWSNQTSITSATTSITFTSNNRFNSNGEKIIFQVGTPASSVQKVNCTFKRFYE